MKDTTTRVSKRRGGPARSSAAKAKGTNLIILGDTTVNVTYRCSPAPEGEWAIPYASFDEEYLECRGDASVEPAVSLQGVLPIARYWHEATSRAAIVFTKVADHGWPGRSAVDETAQEANLLGAPYVAPVVLACGSRKLDRAEVSSKKGIAGSLPADLPRRTSRRSPSPGNSTSLPFGARSSRHSVLGSPPSRTIRTHGTQPTPYRFASCSRTSRKGTTEIPIRDFPGFFRRPPPERGVSGPLIPREAPHRRGFLRSLRRLPKIAD